MDDHVLAELRKKAERAVADMPDGDLKIKAFEVILEKLLGHPPRAGKSTDSHGRIREARSALKKTAAMGGASAAQTLPERIVALREDRFFLEERTISAIRDELRAHGWVYPLTSLSGALQTLVRRGLLRRSLVSEGKKRGYKYVKP